MLSKSTFIRGHQCLKSLYLYKRRNFLRDPLPPDQLAKFMRGSEVGVYARNLFPGGINCQPASPSQYRKAVEKTRQVIESGSHDVIYEAAFQYDQVLILLDILVKENGKWKAYEIKSSLRISETYLADAALQFFVLTNSGIDPHDFSLVHINPDYQRNGGLNIHALFYIESVLEKVKHMQPWVKTLIEAEKEVLTAPHSPRIDIGIYCQQPYPCDFTRHCWKHVKPGSVFDLIGFSVEEKFDLYCKGILHIKDIPAQQLNSAAKRNEYLSVLNGEEFIDFDGLGNYLNQISSTFRFVHFLGRKVAIPSHARHKPYDLEAICISICTENIPAHGTQIWQNKASGDSTDVEALGFLDRHISETDSLVVFDGDRLREFITRTAERHPELSGKARRLKENIVELGMVFEKMLYFEPKLRGDFSPANIARILLGRDIGKTMPLTSDIQAINEFARMMQASVSSEKEQMHEAICNYSTYNVKQLRELYRFLQLKLMD